MPQLVLDQKYRDRCVIAIDLAQNHIKHLLETSRPNACLQKTFGVTDGYIHGDFIWHDAEAIRAILATYRRVKDHDKHQARMLMHRSTG